MTAVVEVCTEAEQPAPTSCPPQVCVLTLTIATHEAPHAATQRSSNCNCRRNHIYNLIFPVRSRAGI